MQIILPKCFIEGKQAAGGAMAMVYSITLTRASLASTSTATNAISRGEQQQQQQVLKEDESPSAVPVRRRPRERWQWSKGDAPGEYGGPPLDFRVRKFWGGEAIPDPITSTDDYIWKKDWQTYLRSLEEDTSSSTSSSTQSPSRQKESEVGFLSLNRSFALDSIEVDLSKELFKPSKSVLALQVEALREGRRTDEAIRQNKTRWRVAPTRREQQQWARARKSAGMASLVSEGGEGQVVMGTSATTTRQDYSRLKGNLQLLTGIFGAVGVSVAYFSYSTEVAFSYGVGLVGALAYIRMLGNSVDSLGQSDSKGAARAALGQPRLLVPVALVMFFNRWNEIVAPEYHLLHLQLIPILVGFFTYKAATVFEVFQDILKVQEEQDQSPSI